jgi:hypothetical protein
MPAKIRKFRFIPYRRQDIVEMCIRENNPDIDIDDFRQLGYMLDQIFHFEFHQVVEALKNAYADTDPDTDTRRPQFIDSRVDVPFVELLDGLLEKANYERVTQADLNLFARGESVRNETVSSWFGLRKTSIEFVNYERVVVYLRIRDDYEHLKHDFASCRAGATLLKLFRNVPKADLEMLFPNTRVMRLIDKLLIGVPALVSGGIVLTTKLGASLVLLGSLFGYWLGVHNQPAEINQASLMALFAGAAALGGYLWKQFNNFKNRKLRFMETLTRNLYFKNLDNNAGVFHRLANDAEEEESKEAILAYYFLSTSEAALSQEELDQKIEHWFDSRWDCRIDFEIDDALQKLLALGLVETSGGRLCAVSISEGIKILDQRWDNYFVAEI